MLAGQNTSCKKRSDTFLDLGLVYAAEHSLMVSIETFGEQPATLKNLVIVNLAKGNFANARVYLGALCKTLFYGEWAGRYLEKLQSGSDFSDDSVIENLRRRMLDKKYDPSATQSETVFLDLLEKDKQNRMAFEYLMAHYMLNVRLDKFAENFQRLEDFNYKRIPPLYEEAVLLYVYHLKKKWAYKPLKISAESSMRYNDFIRIFVENRGDEKKAMDRAAQKHGQSYLFYFFYGFSGIKQ